MEHSTTFLAVQFTAFAVDDRTAWMAGVGLDRRPFPAYADDRASGEPDVFGLWINGVARPGDGSLATWS